MALVAQRENAVRLVEALELIADKPEYAPGETVKLLAEATLALVLSITLELAIRNGWTRADKAMYDAKSMGGNRVCTRCGEEKLRRP